MITASPELLHLSLTSAVRLFNNNGRIGYQGGPHNYEIYVPLEKGNSPQLIYSIQLEGDDVIVQDRLLASASRRALAAQDADEMVEVILGLIGQMSPKHKQLLLNMMAPELS